MIALNNRATHITLVASRPNDALSHRPADSGSAALAKGLERPAAQSLRQATFQTAENPRSPEQQSQNAPESDSRNHVELAKLAMLAIEYCPETASAWATVQKLPRIYQDCFLQIVGAKPQQDTRKLAAILLAKYREILRPYGNDEANNALANARTISAEAEAEFMMVYDLLGKNVEPAKLLRRIETKFGPSHQTLIALEQEKVKREKRVVQQQALKREALEKAIREQNAREQNAREKEAIKRKKQEALDRHALRAQETLMRKALLQEVGGRHPSHIRNLALSALLLPLLAAAIYVIK